MRGAAIAFSFAAALLLTAGAADAGVNYRCLQVCEQAGYKHNYCVPRCTITIPNRSSAPVASPLHGTDYRCVDRCTGTGRPRPYCLRNCAY